MYRFSLIHLSCCVLFYIYILKKTKIKYTYRNLFINITTMNKPLYLLSFFLFNEGLKNMYIKLTYFLRLTKMPD